MTKKWRKVLAILLASAMCLNSVSFSAFAADGTVTNADGTKTTTTTTTSGNKTTVTKSTTGKVEDTVLTGGISGKVVDLVKTEKTETTVTKDSNGNKLSETKKESESGSKTYSVNRLATTNLPNVTVTLVEGSTKSATGTVNAGTTTTNNNPSIGTDTTTRITTAGTRTVTGTMSNLELVATQNKSTAMNLLHYRKTSNNSKTGVWERDAKPNDDNYSPAQDLTGSYIKSSTLKADNYSYYYPEVHYRTEAEYNALPSDVQGKYTKVAWSSLKTAGNTNADALQDLLDYYENNPGLEKPAYMYKLSSLSGWMNPITNGVWWEWVLASNGERAKTSYGNGIKTSNDTHYNPRIAVMIEKNGREAVAYCMDETIVSKPNHRYTLENLDEASYFGSNAEAAKLGIRTVAQYGYWGQINSEFGSRQALASDIVALLNSSNSSVLTSKTYTKTDGSTTTYSKEALIDFIDIGGSDPKLSTASELSNNTALLATQAAIWTYGRNGKVFDGKNFVGRNNNDKIVMQIVYYYLTSDYLKNKVKAMSTTPIIDEKDFYDPASIKITVKGKLDHANNKDSNANNDVYYVDLSFTMNHDLQSGDNLTVTLKNSSGTTLKSAKLGSTGIKRNGRTYTFENLQLQENQDVQYTLSLTGTQVLVKDAYMFKPVDNPSSVQTMVGVGTGTNTVNASSSFKFKYSSTEPTVTETAKREWSWEKSSTTEYVVVSGSKTWNDADNQDGIRPESITINLLANGAKKESKTVKASDGWKWTFGNLPKKDSSGNVITYKISENAVSGYTSAVNGYNVTNTHTPETVNVSGAKTWSDNDNAVGERPSSIIINLHKTVNNTTTKIDSKTVTASNQWKWSFTGLPKYEAGKQITYSITENAVDNYESTVNGYDVTNTYVPKSVDVKGSKTWDDADNRDGKRPASITINLLANGTKVDSKVITEASGWKWEFTDLPRTDGNTAITYTIAEEPVAGYETQINGYDVTNSYIPETTSVSGVKTWNDNDDQDGKRPSSIKINLYAGEVKAENYKYSKLVTAIDGWKWNFTDLPKYENGVEIQYTITEDEVTGYTSQVNGYDVTNSYTPETTSVSGSKTWSDNDNQDGIRPDSITINLLADGTKVDSKTITEAGGWEWTFTNLPKYANGQEITYTITEDTVIGYTPTIAGYNVTNTHVPETIDVEGTKTWNDGDNRDAKRPDSITIRLLKDGVEIDSQTVAAEDGWSWSFTDLPKYANGQEITYTIIEDAVPDYTSQINGYDVTNSYIPETTSVSGAKTWNDNDNQDGIRPDSITIHLLANGRKVDSKTVTAVDEWKWTFADLPKNEAGQPIVYTISEDDVAGYESEVNGYNVTNSYTPEKIDIVGSKAWADADNQDGIRPSSITIRLFGNRSEVDVKTVTAADNWSWEFTDLPKYADGQLITYTITEDAVTGYTPTVNGFNVTNTHMPELVDVEGSKIWDDGNNRDLTRPDSITIRLLADGDEIDSRTVTATDNWSWSFTDLPKYEDGDEIAYTIIEDEVPGYTSDVNGYSVTNSYTPETTSVRGTKTWNDENDQDGKRPTSIVINLLANGIEVDEQTVTAVDGWKWNFTELPKNEAGQPIVYTITEDEVEGYTSEVNGFDVTNTYNPELTSVEGEKTWIDNDDAKGKRPERITIRLLANGDGVETKTVTEADDWKWSFINLPKYEDGNEIDYTITEDEVEGYTSEVNDYDVINTLIPETISVTVNKVWEDENDEDGIRPASIEVQLYANGNVYGDAEVLSEDNEWSYTWTDLPEEYEYTVDELEVPAGYRKSIDGFTITNTHEPEEEIPETINITVRKLWDDENDKDGIRPKSIRVQLYAEYEVTNVLERIDKVQIHNDSNATEIREEDCLQIMTGSNALRTLTDSDAIQIPTDSNADDDGLTGGNEEQFKEEAYGKVVKLDESNNWTYTWYDLPAEYSYRVDELEVPDGYEKTIDGFVITNTHEPEEIIPETTSVTVTKTWNDNNDKSKLRPDSIEVQLYADSEKSGDTITLSEENDWTYTWTDLPVDITYTVDETEVPNRYEKTIKSRGNDFEIINKLIEKRTEPDDDDDDRDRETTAPTTTVPETTAPETTVPETTVPETVIYRGVEIPREILDAYPDKTLDELYDMGVLGAYFENVPVGLLPATTDVTWVWAVLLLLSGLGVAGVSVLGKKREIE